MDKAQDNQILDSSGRGKTHYFSYFSDAEKLNFLIPDSVNVLTLKFGTPMFCKSEVWTGNKITDYLISPVGKVADPYQIFGEVWDEKKLSDYLIELSKPELEIRLTEENGKVCVCIK
ncbi:Uncharacterised protein [Candidatus Tiddalikarchaeum anstoanum]|nr:Uncharacterised protein [Candidatus Tiddalikarchaeum anstoanum]